jgi:hypothetical protein
MSTTIPERWVSPPGDSCAPVRPLRWLVVMPALVGMFLIPKRLGPRIVVSSLGKAVTVYAVTLVSIPVLLTIALGGYVLEPLLAGLDHGQLSTLDHIRLPFVLFVEIVYALARDHPKAAWWALATPAIVAVGVFPTAWLLMPFVNAALRPGRLYVRALKLVMWSVPSILALLATFVMILYFEERDRLGIEPEHAGLTAGLLWLLIWMRTLASAGARVAGPGDGSSQAQLIPHCVRCGYILTGLSIDGRCPECGLEIEASLPTTEREGVTALRRAAGKSSTGARQRSERSLRSLLTAPWTYIRTAWVILGSQKFFDTLAVYAAREQALRFAARTSWVVGFCWTGVMALVAGLLYGWHNLLRCVTMDWYPLIFVPIGTIVACRLLVALTAFLACWLGWRDPRATTTAMCYGAVWWLPLCLYAPVGLLVVSTRYGSAGYGSAGYLVAFGVAAILLIWAGRRCMHAVRAVRYASL